uniref:Uncharacterized protein n=1 Tax=Vitis vinifera TaxID=29760 RepID=A5AKK2_VITVI|nr:hypothetical protein VITISV_012119 [Vitis vinifera]
MSDEITPITLATLYEMMVDLTRRVERIELILSEYPLSSRGALRVGIPSLPHLTSPASVTLGASHPRPRLHSMLQQHSSSISLVTSTRPPSRLRGPPVITVPQERLHPRRRCRRHFSDLKHTPEAEFLRRSRPWDFWLLWFLGHFQILFLHSFDLIYIVECEEFEPMVVLAWRGISYDLWVAYDEWIG